MKIYTTPTHYILDPDCHNITPEIADFLAIAYKSMPKDKKVAFDLSIVDTCSNKFFMMFEKINLEREVAIINMNDKIMASLCLMRFDIFAKIFTNDIDLFSDKHEVVNRRLSVVAI
ncbi:MAG: hypothetical protein ACI4S3_08550 [Candidatus Gastranaerophilaceae bacterium]